MAYQYNQDSDRQQYEDWHRYGRERGFFDRMSDEIRSWFGDDDAERRRQEDMQNNRYRGRGGRSGGPQPSSELPEWQQKNYSGPSPRGSYIEEQGRYDEPANMPGRRGLRHTGGFWGGGQRTQRGGWYGERGMNRWGGNELPQGGMFGGREYRQYDEGYDRMPRNWEDEYTNAPRFFEDRERGQWGRGGYGGNREENMPSYRGRGPRGYVRSDERISDEIHQFLTYHPELDATDIDVIVENGIVTLRGSVDSRYAKRLAEDICEEVYGVKEVHNELRINRGLQGESLDREDQLGRTRLTAR